MEARIGDISPAASIDTLLLSVKGVSEIERCQISNDLWPRHSPRYEMDQIWVKDQRNGNEDVDKLVAATCCNISGDNLLIFEDHVSNVKSEPDKVKQSSIWQIIFRSHVSEVTGTTSPSSSIFFPQE